MGIIESTTHNKEEKMSIKQHIDSIGVEKFLRKFWAALLEAGFVNSNETITIDGQTYTVKWPSDDHMYLEGGKGAPYVSARYLFQEDIEEWEEENNSEHWGGTVPRWLYCGALDDMYDHHLENGKYTKYKEVAG